MTQDQIRSLVSKITEKNQLTIITFNDNTRWMGFFEIEKENLIDEKNNYWSFVKDGKKRNDEVFFDGNSVVSIDIIENVYLDLHQMGKH